MSSVNAKYTEHVMRGAKPISRTFRKDEKSNGTDKKRLVLYDIRKL